MATLAQALEVRFEFVVATDPQHTVRIECKVPICQKRSIVGVTAKIVADHNHHTGDIRDFICDSCNTGLGRFKNGKDCLRDALRYIEEREFFSNTTIGDSQNETKHE